VVIADPDARQPVVFGQRLQRPPNAASSTFRSAARTASNWRSTSASVS